MHIHRLEKIWLVFGMSMLAVFLIMLGVSAFAMGMQTPGSAHAHALDPTRLEETAPFDKPGVTQTGDKEYEAVLIAYGFGFNPDKIEIPAGSTVKFTATSSDVVHGFEIPGTTVNFMVLPGEVSHLSYTFDKPGEYLFLCNEYCGVGHQSMFAKLIVT